MLTAIVSILYYLVLLAWSLAYFVFMLLLFALTVVKSATGRFRIEQALSFFLKYPAGLALLSLVLVWMGC